MAVDPNLETRHSQAERQEMLAAIGVESVSDLFSDVPEGLRFPDIDLPEPLSEPDLAREIGAVAGRNTRIDDRPCFLGAGSYRHFVPAIVDYVLQRGEFYTSYTPYQPEMSQGMLQAIFEYQSMICRLTGMDVSNASHYDGATSLAEAVLLALDTGKGKRRRVLLARSVQPHYRQVVETYLQGTDAELVVPDDPLIPAARLAQMADAETAAVVVQSPNFFGCLEDLDGIAETVHAAGALLIVATDPIALGLFRPPGDDGADVVVADGQPLGLSPSFGGPSLGIFATRETYMRRLVGRLVGETVDVERRRGYVLTLATREQHIRRARATSNICTNSALGALAASVYLATLGKQGLRRVAELCFHKSQYAAGEIGRIPGIAINPGMDDRAFFREFVVELPIAASKANRRLMTESGIVGGYDLGRAFPGRGNQMLLAVTEMNTRGEIDRMVRALEEVVAS